MSGERPPGAEGDPESFRAGGEEEKPEDLFQRTVKFLEQEENNSIWTKSKEIRLSDDDQDYFTFEIGKGDEQFTMFTLMKSEFTKSGEDKGDYDSESTHNTVVGVLHEDKFEVLGLEEPHLREMVEEFSEIIESIVAQREESN